MSAVMKFPGPVEFFFNSPLYSFYNFLEEIDSVATIISGDIRIDGYCPYCQEKSIFYRGGSNNSTNFETNKDLLKERSNECLSITLTCARSRNHHLYFYIKMKNGIIGKIGQFPSLADISLDESKQFDRILNSEDKSEFHKAIGLAAHGVGIGSFVYLRRIFERLIYNRYKEFKEAERWSDDEFSRYRMSEKINFLKSHLPPFLVEHKDIYGILSKGIHELSEKECLTYFEVMKMSITEILEEDKRNKEMEEKRKALSAAIKNLPASTTQK